MTRPISAYYSDGKINQQYQPTRTSPLFIKVSAKWLSPSSHFSDLNFALTDGWIVGTSKSDIVAWPTVRPCIDRVDAYRFQRASSSQLAEILDRVRHLERARLLPVVGGWKLNARLVSGHNGARSGKVPRLLKGITISRSAGAKLLIPFCLMALAEVCAKAG
jgi:hypothetical protein